MHGLTGNTLVSSNCLNGVCIASITAHIHARKEIKEGAWSSSCGTAGTESDEEELPDSEKDNGPQKDVRESLLN